MIYPNNEIKSAVIESLLQDGPLNAKRLLSEINLLKPQLIILVGKLAMSQFINFKKLNEVVGQIHSIQVHEHVCDAIPLPHPSGASTWPLKEPGKTLLQEAMQKIQTHPAWKRIIPTHPV